jgi:hypothetical protein
VTEPAVDPVVQTGAPADTPPPTRDEVAALTRAQIHETYGVPEASKDEMVDAVLDQFGAPRPNSKETVLAVGFPVDSHVDGGHVIANTGTTVPSKDAAGIIARAAAQGITIREVR